MPQQNLQLTQVGYSKVRNMLVFQKNLVGHAISAFSYTHNGNLLLQYNVKFQIVYVSANTLKVANCTMMMKIEQGAKNFPHPIW